MKNQRGFTLLELMVVVAMVAIVATISAPSWQNFVANRRAAGASRGIYNTLMHVRMLAIKEGKTVTMRYMNGVNPVSAATKDSLQAFTQIDLSWDKNGDGSAVTEVFYKVAKNVTCKTPKNTMAYNSRGIIMATNSGRLETSNAHTDRVYRVIVNSLGTIREE